MRTPIPERVPWIGQHDRKTTERFCCIAAAERPERSRRYRSGTKHKTSAGTLLNTSGNSHLACHKTLPVSPLRLRKAVLSCAISTSRVSSTGFVARCLGLEDRRDLWFEVDGGTRGTLESFSITSLVSLKVTVRISSCESRCPRPRKSDVPSAEHLAARLVYKRNT